MTGNRSSRSGGDRPARRIDPRLQARRRSVARSESIRRLWTVGGLTLVTSVALVAIAVLNSPWLDVDDVQVVGVAQADPRQIMTAAAVAVGDPLVEIDTGEVAAAVMEVPWVADATVERSWSGEITITVVERVGVAALPTGSRFALVDQSGQQLEVVDHRPDGFLPVIGVEESGVPGEQVSAEGRLVVSLVEALYPEVEAVTGSIVVSEGRLLLELATGEQVKLGDDRALDEKLASLETVLARVDLDCITYIDARVPSNPAVKRGRPGAVSRDAGADAADQEPYLSEGGC